MNVVSKDKLLDLSGKVAIVTGGSLGIGFGISYRLAEAGATVIVVGRRVEEAHKTADELTVKGWKAAPYGADVANEEQVKNLVGYVADHYGKIDILVNNAGIFPFAMVADMPTEQFDQVLATNLRGVFLTTKYVSNHMKASGVKGKIINISSIDSLHPSMAGLAAYDASKHGVWGFTKNVALELAKSGITVNNVAPGGIMTPGVAAMQSGGKETTTERFPEPTPMEVPMGRMGVPDDIGKVVLFLASDMSGYMTGTQVVVDGGYLLS
jgi:2-deoxy-D-gluconate 3-dehydrogenase